VRSQAPLRAPSHEWTTRDVVDTIKPFILGYVIVTIGCYVGLGTKGGTQGVGRSTTNAVVAASVAVIAVDFFVTRLLFTLLY